MIPVIPPNQPIKSTPVAAEIYQLDSSPLDHRQPVLLVHGLKDENLRMFHWQHVCKYLESDPKFHRNYKIYLARWSTSAPEKKMAASFKPVLRDLASSAHQPIIVVTLSIAGNVIRDAMEDPAVDDSVAKMIALGSPFHGSPLFSRDWMQYSFFKHYKRSFTLADRSILYSIYFKFHPNLQREYYWDNCDGQVPKIGKYSFIFPVRAKGDVIPPAEPPAASSVTNSADKIVAYAGYLKTRFIPNHRSGRLKGFCRSVISFFDTTVPMHLGRQRAVVRALNFEMANMHAVDREKSPYALNDGIATVASSLSLPSGEAVDISCDDEESMAKLKAQANVAKARVFEDIDHLTFLDGHRPLKSRQDQIVDCLNPEEKPRPMFAWLKKDIESDSIRSNPTVANKE